jgi:hypothetical protein
MLALADDAALARLVIAAIAIPGRARLPLSDGAVEGLPARPRIVSERLISLRHRPSTAAAASCPRPAAAPAPTAVGPSNKWRPPASKAGARLCWSHMVSLAPAQKSARGGNDERADRTNDSIANHRSSRAVPKGRQSRISRPPVADLISCSGRSGMGLEMRNLTSKQNSTFLLPNCGGLATKRLTGVFAAPLQMTFGSLFE